MLNYAAAVTDITFLAVYSGKQRQLFDLDRVDLHRHVSRYYQTILAVERRNGSLAVAVAGRLHIDFGAACFCDETNRQKYRDGVSKIQII